MEVNLKSKVVVITGASRGIGRALAKAFAIEGASVVINYNKSFNEANELLHDISEFNSNCLLVQADVTKQKEVIRLKDEVMKKYASVDILINNAGACRDGLCSTMSYNDWFDIVDLNMNSVFICSKIFSRNMIKNKSGKIINISSLKGILGTAGQVNYSASKAAILGFTKSLALELGNYNISVNAICPGYIETDLNKGNLTKREKATRSSVLGVDNSLDDLINFILFMSSDKMSGVSGRIFNLDSRIKS